MKISTMVCPRTHNCDSLQPCDEDPGHVVEIRCPSKKLLIRAYSFDPASLDFMTRGSELFYTFLKNATDAILREAVDKEGFHFYVDGTLLHITANDMLPLHHSIIFPFKAYLDGHDDLLLSVEST